MQPLEGEFASIWIYDSERKEMSAFASYPALFEDQEVVFLGETRRKGLHITNRLVKQMGGTVWVESQGGRTKFWIMLPLARP
jgi:hypothetical protein